MLHVRGLTKEYRSNRNAETSIVALSELDLHVLEGEFLTVVGPSGCGKTTLLRMIAGFEAPDSGSITVAGRPMVAPGMRFVPAHERGIGLVPQEGALFPHLSVAQNVGFGLRRMSRSKRDARVAEVLALVGLEGYGPRRPDQLSGGQQQRVAVARAIAPSPRVILLDEPFSALDESLRKSLRAELRQLLRSLGTTTVLVTHDQEEALSLADRVAILREGSIVQVCSPREAYYRPCDLELAEFLGDAVVVEGRITGSDSPIPTVSCVFGNLPVGSWHGADGNCKVMVRPEHIVVNTVSSPQQGMAEGVPNFGKTRDEPRPGPFGVVCDQTFYGHDGTVLVEVAELGTRIEARVMGDRKIAIGQSVWLCVDQPVCTYPSIDSR